MPKDYKHRVPGTLRRSSRRRRKPWLWALPAILAGVAALAVFRFSGRDDAAPDPAAANPASESGEAAKQPAGPPDPTTAAAPKEKKAARDTKPKKPASSEKVPVVDLPEPRFTFYKILPEKEVIVPESEIRNLAREEKSGKGEASGGYLIQAGSFKTLEEAEKTKARLAEAKVKAKMEKVIIENVAWYRVKVGPYKSLTDAEKTRAYLRKNKIDSVLQQTRP